MPSEFEGTEEDATASYNLQALDCVNFDNGRVKPSLSIYASLGAEVHRNEKFSTRLQADGQNLNNRLNVIVFGTLFSRGAIRPARSWFLRLATNF